MNMFRKNDFFKKDNDFLKKKVFFTETKWPHFNLLFNDIKKFNKKENIQY